MNFQKKSNGKCKPIHKSCYKTFQKITLALMKDLKLIFISGLCTKSQAL